MINDANNRIRIGDFVSIYRRGKRRIYTADFWHNGQHHRISLRTRNLKIARQRALALDVKLTNGEYQMAPKTKSISEGIEDYIKHLQTEDRRKKTTVRYRGILNVFRDFADAEGVRQLTQVNLSLVDGFRAERKKVLAPKSMRNEGVLLKSFFRWCKQRRLVAQNPLEEMTFPKPKLAPRGGPSLDQIDQLLSSVSGSRLAQLAVLAFTGMRSGELQRLRTEDVDLTSNWIHVVSREGAETKTGHSRKIPIHPRLKPYLEGISKRERSWFFTATASEKYLDGNHHISTKHLNEDFLKVLERLKLPAGRNGGFTIHSLRHSFETICVNAGIPQRVVDTWLGHRSDNSMASIYYRLSDEDSQKFINQVPFGAGKPPADGDESES